MHGTMGEIRVDETLNVVAEIRATHPQANEAELAQMLANRLRQDETEFVTACRRLVHGALITLGRLERAQRARRDTEEDDQAETAALADLVRCKVLLDLTMPNNKAMRFCTGADMAGFGEIYCRIASAVPPTMMVGEIMTESDVRALLTAGDQ